jgi:hypothetical protein
MLTPSLPEQGTPSGISVEDAEGVAAINVSGDRLTPQEIIDYIEDHGVLGATGPVTMIMVECMDGRTTEEKYGEGIQRRDDRELCTATLDGAFSYVSLPEGAEPQAEPSQAIAVFDAVTGNLLVVAIGNDLGEPSGQ